MRIRMMRLQSAAYEEFVSPISRVVLLAALLALFAPSAVFAATEVRKLSVNGEARIYRLYVPPAVRGGRAPLVVGLHGAVQSAAEFEADFGLNKIAQREGFAVAYPEGVNRVWDDARPPMMRLGYIVQPGDDVLFITALVRDLIARGVADPSRIYVAGLSMGGFMAARMACERADLFAAVAMMAATVPEQYRRDCAPSRTMPVLMMHGTYDPIVPWFGMPMGGVGILSAADTAQLFADLAGCMIYADSQRASLDKSPPIAMRRWSICRDNAQVILYVVPGGGHLPPSADPGRGDTFVSLFLTERSHAIDAAEEIWRFFRQHRASQPS
jgi:polyhydroxybutyrate depolymerase